MHVKIMLDQDIWPPRARLVGQRSTDLSLERQASNLVAGWKSHIECRNPYAVLARQDFGHRPTCALPPPDTCGAKIGARLAVPTFLSLD